MKRAVIYVRVSTTEQAQGGYSIEAQLEACRRYAREQGWIVVREYRDAGESATTAARPQLRQMLTDLTSGEVSASHLVFHKYDRLARNVSDHLGIIERLKRQGIASVSATERIEDTPAGRMVSTIIASVAAWYSENLGQEAKKGMEQKAREGLWPSFAPLGYLNVRKGTGRHAESVLQPDPAIAPLVREAFELYASGRWTLTSLHAEMTRRGLRTRTGKPWSRSKLAKALSNKVYVGIVSWGEVERPGIHEPLVSQELFDRVQVTIKDHDKAGPRVRRHPHHLRGTLFCRSCGSRLCFTLAKGKGGGVFPYFFCVGRSKKRTECKERAVQVAEVDAQVAALYTGLKLSDSGRRQLLARLDAEIAEQEAAGVVTAARDTARLARLQSEREMLMQALYDKAISTELLKSEQARIDAEEEELRRRLAIDRTALVRARDLADRALRVLTDCAAWYGKAEAELRQAMNRALFSAIYVGDGIVRSFELREPLQALFAPWGLNSVPTGEPGGIRTHDQGIKSPLLYR